MKLAPHEIESLAQGLDEPDALLSRWMSLLFQRSWRLSKDLIRTEPVELLRERCRHFCRCLGHALRMTDSLAPGSPAFRESVQSLSFTAGWMAGAGLTVTDAVALVHALEEALGWPHRRFFQSLLVVVTEAFASSLVQRERARYRDAMEKSQVVCDLHPRLPCLLLVGDPDRQALEDAVGRAMMLAAMRDARVVLVDGSTLIAPETALPIACAILADHGEAASVKVVVGGVPEPVARGLDVEGLLLFESWGEALEGAMQESGLACTERESG